MRRRSLALSLLFVASLFLGLCNRADAYGMGTHVEIGKKAWPLITRVPRYAHLKGNETARRAFLYGSFFPDIQTVASRAAPQLDSLKKKLEARSFVKEVRLSTAGITPLTWSTHSISFLIPLVTAAEKKGDPVYLAFCLGNLAHAVMDNHAETVYVQRMIARTRVGDLGVDPNAKGAVGSFEPGTEMEACVEGILDRKQPCSTGFFLRDATYRIVGTGSWWRRVFGSFRASTRLKLAYHAHARTWTRTHRPGATPISGRGFLNLCRIFEAGLVFYPHVIGCQKLGEAGKTFKKRYLKLSWWARALSFFGDVLGAVVSLGQFDMTAFIIGKALPPRKAGGLIGSGSPFAEILYMFGQGRKAVDRVKKKYRREPEAKRLFASGLLDPGFYPFPRQAVTMVADVAEKLRGSLFTDRSIWPGWDRNTFRSAALQSLARRVGAPFRPDPKLLVDSFHITDGAGRPVRTLRYPADDGKALRATLRLFGTAPSIRWFLPQTFTMRVREDLGGPTARDPIVATKRITVPGADLRPKNYVSRRKPILSIDFQAAMSPGSRGFYVELLYRGGILFTTDFQPFGAVATGLQYKALYGTYDHWPHSVRVK